MVGFPSGLPGGPAVSPVEEASKREVACATTPSRPTVGSLAKGRIQKCVTVNISCVQWMVAGRSGALGKNARGAVGVATEPGPELAVIHPLSTAGGLVKGALWK